VGLRVRIHFPPAASPLRTWALSSLGFAHQEGLHPGQRSPDYANAIQEQRAESGEVRQCPVLTAINAGSGRNSATESKFAAAVLTRSFEAVIPVARNVWQPISAARTAVACCTARGHKRRERVPSSCGEM
jgi:hypothetical protein